MMMMTMKKTEKNVAPFSDASIVEWRFKTRICANKQQ